MKTIEFISAPWQSSKQQVLADCNLIFNLNLTSELTFWESAKKSRSFWATFENFKNFRILWFWGPNE